MAAVAAEIRECLGGQVQQVYQPEPETVLLVLRARGANRSLLLSAHSRHARAYFTARRGQGGSAGTPDAEATSAPERTADAAPARDVSPARHHPPTPPPAFCMLLRKHLKGATLIEARQVDFDRILHLRFRYADTVVLLVLEAMGKHSNLILVSPGGVVLDAIKRVGARESRLRPVQPGLPFSPPPIGGRADPASATPEQLRAALAAEPEAPVEGALLATFHLAPAALEAVLRRCGAGSPRPADADADCLARELRAVADPSTYAPALLRDARGVPVDAAMLPDASPPPGGAREPAASASAALDLYYAYRTTHEAVEGRRRELLRALSEQIRFFERRIREAEEGVEAARKAPDLEREATLLITNLNRIARGAQSVTVVDFYDPEQKEVTLPLDAAVPPREQAEKRFKRARKLVDAVPHLERQWEEEQARLEGLQALRPSLEAARTTEELDALVPSLRDLGALRARPAQAPSRRAETGPGMERRDIGGFEVLLGRNATENDHLTTRVADPDDLWLHARGITSAHVVIRTAKHPERVPYAVLLEAAKMCALHSAAKHSRLVPVDYTLRKHVVKRRGSAPGSVQYTHEKTLHVEPGLD